MKKSLLLACFLALPALVNGGTSYTSPQSDFSAAQIANAIYKAEGGPKAAYPYGIIARRRLNEAQARRWCLNTIANNRARYAKPSPFTLHPSTFLDFLASRYAPIGAANDPHHLNQNWLKNVRYFLAQ